MKRWVWGILIPAVPILGYTLAFAYEAGFCTTFSIPIELIQIQISSIFFGSLSALLIFAIIFQLVNISLIASRPKSLGPISLGLIRLSPGLAILTVYLLFFREEWRIWVVFAILVAFFSFLEFGLPLLTHESRKSRFRKRASEEGLKTPISESTPIPEGLKLTYREKLEYQEQIDIKPKDIFYYIGGSYQIIFLFLFIASFVLFISFGYGHTVAMNQKEYLIPSTNYDSVVLRIYGNNAICTQVFRETHEINKSFFVIDISSDPSTVFKLEKVGPLKLTGTQMQ